MSDLSTLKKALPEMEHSFSLIEEVGSLTKMPFSGNFSCRITNLKTQAQIDKLRASLNEGLSDLSAGTKQLHAMIAHLRYALTDSPKWWKEADHGYDLLDYNLVQKVYDKVIEFENKWYDEVWGDKKEESKDASKA